LTVAIIAAGAGDGCDAIATTMPAAASVERTTLWRITFPRYTQPPSILTAIS